MDMTPPAWRKSSYSGSSGDTCVEAASSAQSLYGTPRTRAAHPASHLARIHPPPQEHVGRSSRSSPRGVFNSQHPFSVGVPFSTFRLN